MNPKGRRKPKLEEHRTPIGGEVIFSRCSRTQPGMLSRDAVVFIHGLIVSGDSMLPTARLLADQYRVLVPDLPGYGRSSKPGDCLDISQLAEIMLSWMRTMEVPKATLVANSFGCHVAAEMAALMPANIERLILIGPPDGKERRLLVQLGRLLYDALYEDPSLIPLVWTDFCQVQASRAIRTFGLMTEHCLHAALKRSGVETLLVHGENDPLAPAEWMQHTVEEVNAAALHMLPATGHSTNYSNPSGTAALIHEALQLTRRTDDDAA